MAELTPEAEERVFGKEASSNNGKSPSVEDAGLSPLCPQCKSKKLWRDGFRYPMLGNQVQRWLCRDCSYRFSEKPSQEKQEWSINKPSYLPSSSQICVSETKNLGSATELKTVAGEKKSLENKKHMLPQRKNVDPESDEVRALVAVYRGWLEKEGFAKESHYPSNLLRLVRVGADLHDPESVKTVIDRIEFKKGTKLQYVYAYDAFDRMLKLNWEPPSYSQEETIPFLPEEDLDCLIAACRRSVMATYLQCLKETFGGPGEVLRIMREDVQGNIVTINHPVKGHLPRQLEVSNKLIAMLNALPHEGSRYFLYSYSTLWSCYDKVRKRAAEVHKNPVLLQVELRSFRHWAGTMLAILTNGNVTIVQGLLGHKRVENTMKYIDLAKVRSKGVNDECDVATANSPEEMKQVLGAGFQFIAEKFGVMWFTRPKRFRGLLHLEDKRRSAMISLK
jgi:integrase